MNRMIAGLMLLAGCSYTPDEYEDEWVGVFCEKTVSCGYGDLFSWKTAEDCRGEYSADPDLMADPSCEGFDGDAARECVDGYRGLDCDEMFDPEQFPAACDQICP